MNRSAAGRNGAAFTTPEVYGFQKVTGSSLVSSPSVPRVRGDACSRVGGLMRITAFVFGRPAGERIAW